MAEFANDTEEAQASAPTIDGPTSAAILMMLLEQNEASAILATLSPEDVRRLGKAMFESADAREEQVEAALVCFVERSRQVPTLSIGAEPYIRSVMSQALGNVRADNVLASIAPQSSADVLEMLRWMDVSVIGRIIAEEHPQVAALVLAVMTPQAAAQALEAIPDDIQADLLYRAAQLSSVSAEAISDLEYLLNCYDDAKAAASKIALGGQGEIAKIVNAMPKARGERVLKTVKKRDKVLAQKIEDEMFTFEDLIALDVKSLGALLRDVETETLTLALKGAGEAIVEKALGTLSARAAQTIRDDMAERGPTKRSDVDAAQREMIAIARQLAADGTISMGAQGNDYV
jgi:flagellar motor switch protein FliG